MKKYTRSSHCKSTKGFSLVELLLVIAIVGIIAAISIPFLIKAKYSSENGATVATMRAMVSTQLSYFSTAGRYARMSELNNISGGAYGTTVPDGIQRGSYFMELSPEPNPSDAQLRNTFTLKVTKTARGVDEDPFVATVGPSGQIQQILP